MPQTLDGSGVPPEELEFQLFSCSHLVLLRRVAPSRRLTTLLNLLETSCSSPDLSLSRAASYCGTEKNHLNMLLRASTGFTFHSLLIRYRLYNASKLILSSDLTFLEIAHKTGFGSLSSFERNFFRLLGQTPREYRRREPRFGNKKTLGS